MGKMKLYCFDMGDIQLDKGFMTAGKDMGKSMTCSRTCFACYAP